MQSRVSLTRLLIVLLVLIAGQAAGLGHAASRLPEANVIAFLANGGTLDDICDDVEGGDAYHDHLRCGACLLVGPSALLMLHHDAGWQQDARPVVQTQVTVAIADPQRRLIGWSVRGPPSR
jgi:hypothetical protein